MYLFFILSERPSLKQINIKLMTYYSMTR